MKQKKRSKYYLSCRWLHIWNIFNDLHGGYFDARALFSEFRAQPSHTSETFSEILFELVKKIDANNDTEKVSKFYRMTHLANKFLDKHAISIDENSGILQRNVGERTKAKMSTIISILMGLNLHDSYRDRLFSSSGISFVPKDIVSEAYKFLLLQRGRPDFEEIMDNKKTGEKMDVIEASNHILNDIYEANRKEMKINVDSFMLGEGSHKAR